MQRADIFYPQLTYGSREPQIKVEPIIARNTKTYPHKLGKRRGKGKKKKLPLIEDKAALWRYYKKVIAEQEVMHVGDLEASAFFDKWKKVKKNSMTRTTIYSTSFRHSCFNMQKVSPVVLKGD